MLLKHKKNILINTIILFAFFLTFQRSSFAAINMSCYSGGNQMSWSFVKKAAKWGTNHNRHFVLLGQEMIWCSDRIELKGTLKYSLIEKVEIKKQDKQVIIHLNKVDRDRGPGKPLVLLYKNKEMAVFFIKQLKKKIQSQKTKK